MEICETHRLVSIKDIHTANTDCDEMKRVISKDGFAGHYSKGFAKGYEQALIDLGLRISCN